MKNDEEKKLNTTGINHLVGLGNKILEILYILFIILLVYVVTLIFREWKVLSIIGKILSVISPLFVGWFIAWLLHPIVEKLENKGVKKSLSVICAYLIFLLIVGGLLAFIIPSLANQMSDLVTQIPNITNEITGKITDFFSKIPNSGSIDVGKIQDGFVSSIQSYSSELQTNLPSMAVSLVSNIASGVGFIVLSLVLAFYILFDFDKASEALIGLFPKKAKKDIMYLLDKLDDSLYSFISGTLWLSLLLFVSSLIGFTIIGLNAPVLVTIICVITNLIPYIGPWIGAAIAAIIGFAQSPLTGFLTLGFIFVVQLIDGEILNPLVMSKKLNLSPITIIISLLIFEYLFGMLGMVIATPCVALIKVIYVFLDEKYDFFNFLDK